jgi:hypothetical protein
MSLADIDGFSISTPLLAETRDALMGAGSDGYECFVLWSGEPNDREFIIRQAHVPAQKAYKTGSGLLVRVEGDALHALNAWLFEHSQTLAAQVHAHPTRAYHSNTDDTYPIVTALGGLSVVAPDFASRGVLTRGTALYRLGPSGWRRVPRRRSKRTLHVTD